MKRTCAKRHEVAAFGKGVVGRILVTGGGGFLGSHVVKQLLEMGREVRTTARNPETAEFLKGFGDVEIVKMDLLDLDSIRVAVANCEEIIHCAAPLYINAKNTQKNVVDPSILGTKNLVEALTNSDVKKIVHTSSVAAIRSTNYQNGRMFTTDDWCNDATLKSNPYGLAKAGAEKVMREWVEGSNIRLITIHPSILFGKPLHSRHLEGSMSYMKHFLKGPPFVLNIHINFVDVEDTARAHVAALEKGVDGNRYLIHSGGMWMKEIGNHLTKVIPERKWARRRLPSIFAYFFAIIHPKLSLRMLKDNLGTQVDYDASAQFDLIENVKPAEGIIEDTMRGLLS
ncbi:MAG: SDR family NAD(P)-dependent oxidoreductase [Euryarchaeota archaeon]|nr:SDR family NAD(P)-dependent oxidoreductase [Euryarchaeota archaeon]